MRWWRIQGLSRRRDGRSWSGGRGQRQKKQSAPVVKEILAVSLSSSQERVSRRRGDPPACGRAETASSGCIRCPPSSEGSRPPKATGSSKLSRSSKMWFIGSLKGFLGPRQLPTAQSSPTRQHGTKSTKNTTTTVVINKPPLRRLGY